MLKEKTQALIPQTPAQPSVIDTLPLMQLDPDEAAILAENIGDLGDAVAQYLPRYAFPSGNNGLFMPSDASRAPLREIVGVVIGRPLTTRTLWPDVELSGDRPLCKSDDGVKGDGAPGGECAKCVYNAFGTGLTKDGKNDAKGKACREYRVFALVTPHDTLPATLKIPPASLRALNAFRVSVLANHKPPLPISGIVLKIGAEKAKKGTGFVATFTLVSELSPTARSAIQERTAKFAAAIQRAAVATTTARDAADDSARYDGGEP